MLLSEVKNQILSLGFEDATVLGDADHQAYFRDGINKALTFINAEFPLIETYELSLDGNGDDIDEINFADLSDFDVLLNATIKKELDGRMQILPFGDFTLLNDSYVYVNQDIEGDITFFYRRKFTPITTSTADNVTVDVHYKAEELVPLLASYYIWEDDSPDKAAKWFNEYERLRNMIFATSQKPKPVSFTGGI